MKKVYIIMALVCLSLAYQSCTPQSIADQNPLPQACCGEEGNIPPPPPPPPPGGGLTGG